MIRKTGVLLVFMVLITAIGCGGAGSDQQSSVNLDIAILNAEGEILIKGMVFKDLDGDTVMDRGEPGIEGVMVSLVGVEDTITNAMGMYSFSVTVSRAYTVSGTDPVGYFSTTPNEVVVLAEGDNVTVDFGLQNETAPWFIYGIVYDDLNKDGIMDSNEPGIPDVIVSLEGHEQVMTGMDGCYALTVADNGMYSVEETDPEGYYSTSPNMVAVGISASNVRVDFGDSPVEEITVDVKPGSDISPLNLRSKGVLPVAVLGSEEMDVDMIDPASLRLNGVPPLRWNSGDECDADGYNDLNLKFSTQEIAATLGEVERGDIVTLIMTGIMMDGTHCYGEETVWIVQAQK